MICVNFSFCQYLGTLRWHDMLLSFQAFDSIFMMRKNSLCNIEQVTTLLVWLFSRSL